MRGVLFIFLVSFLSHSTWAQVWDDTNSWDTNFEAKYSEWVKKSWKTDIFSNRNSKYYGIKTDCADATYAMRAIFAYENKLPFVIKNPFNSSNTIPANVEQRDFKSSLNTSGEYTKRYLMSHLWSNSRWNSKGSVGSLARFKAFLVFMMDNVNTKTLANDSYPVAINRKSLKPGSFFLSLDKEHSYQIKDVTDYGVVKIYYSTTPKIVRNLLTLDGFPVIYPDLKLKFTSTASNQLNSINNVTFKDGYRSFYLPKHYKLGGAPSSNEQYELLRQVGDLELGDAMIKKLALPGKVETIEQKLNRYYMRVCLSVRSRIEVVDNALKAKRSIGNQCLNSSQYYSHSTPSRDGRVKKSYQLLLRLLNQRFNDLNKSNISNELESLRDYAVSLFINPNDTTPMSEVNCQAQVSSNFERWLEGLFNTAYANSSNEEKYHQLVTNCMQYREQDFCENRYAYLVNQRVNTQVNSSYANAVSKCIGLGHSRQICESKFINLKLREEKLGKNSTAPIIINPIVNETSSTSNLNTNNISKQSIPQFRTFRPFNNNDMKGELGCAIEYQSNRRISLRDVWFRMNNQKLGSDPNGTIQQRWGFCQQPNTSCPKY